jgi:hypothetical protein
MPSPRALLALAATLAAALTLAAPAAAQTPRVLQVAPTGKHCLDESRTKVILSQTLGGQLNPLGGEHQLALSMCTPLIRTPGILYDYTNIEGGLVNYLSPTYVHQGGFLSITPLSVLQLRAEFTGIYIWTLPLNGAGYFPFSSYDGDFTDELRPPEKAATASGSAFSFTATLRGQIGIRPGLDLLLANTLLAEYFSIGTEAYYHNLRRDILAARSDWILKNTTAVLAEYKLTDNLALRGGFANDVTVVPESGYVTNITGLLATFLVRRIGGTIRNFQPFVRVGVYTHHGSSAKFRTGEMYGLAGANVLYELSASGDDPPAPATAAPPSQ